MWVTIGLTLALFLTLGATASPLVGGASAAPAEGEKPKEPTVDHCAVGDAYRDAHREEDAAGAYKKALEKDPELDCAVNGLEETGPNDLTRSAEEITGSIPTILTILALLALVYYGVLFCCRWKRLKEVLVRAGPIGDHVKRVLRPRLTFTDFADDAVDGSPGAPLTARVKERLSRMREEALSGALEYDLDFGTPREEFADQISDDKPLQTALDSAGEVSEQTKLVAALIKIVSLMLPIRRFAVSGTLEPPTNSAALTLMLAEEGHSEATTRLQSPAADEEIKAKDYMMLANPAAVWVQYGVACTLTGEEWGETKAQSQALLREGLDRYHRDELEEARDAFESAIVRDHTNWGAYVSLAVAEARLGSAYEGSIERILKGIEAMKEAGETEVADA